MQNTYSLALLLEDGDRDERANAERALLRLLDEVTDAIEGRSDANHQPRPGRFARFGGRCWFWTSARLCID